MIPVICTYCKRDLIWDDASWGHPKPECAMWLQKQREDRKTMGLYGAMVSTAATGLTQSTTKIDPELYPCHWCGATVVVREEGQLMIHSLPVCGLWDQVRRVDVKETQSFSTPSTAKIGNKTITVETIETPKPNGRYSTIGQEIGELVEKKQQAYGDSFGKSGAVLRILYPNGVPPEQLDDALTIVRILDKIFRVATDRDALGESPYRDIVGYGLLALARIEKEKK